MSLVDLLLLFLVLSPVLINLLSRAYSRITLSWWPFMIPAAFLMLTFHIFLRDQALELILWAPSKFFSLGLKLDLLSGVIATSVVTIGVVVARFSVKYLQDDPNRDRFFRNLSFTLSCILTMLLSPNLVLLFLSWFGTSYFLHQLLTHFRERQGAQEAAQQKFIVSRLGDLFILSAGGMLVWIFQSLDFSEIFRLAQDSVFLQQNQMGITLTCVLLVLGAMTKSAQFPFHSWLPNTMETPTPVSALMHAGIINAGGYLVLRLSPLLQVSSLALSILAVVGGLTAFLATLTMFAQTNVKKTLAYSTVAQMGFMMLQCGLGAFSMAVVHIVGHSFYKAHAFLSSGTATDFGRLQRYFPQRSLEPSSLALVGFGLGSLALIFAGFVLLGYDFGARPGMLVLVLILSLALAQIVLGSQQKWRAFLVSGSIFLAYVVLAEGMRHLMGGILPMVTPITDSFLVGALIICAFFFVGLYLIQNNLRRISETEFGKRIYVRALKGGV